MKKFILLFVMTILLLSNAYADSNDRMYSASSASSITDTSITTHGQSRGVWVGTTQSIDLSINGSWITFQGATAGTVLPVFANGARITSGSASPAAGDVVFLY